MADKNNNIINFPEEVRNNSVAQNDGPSIPRFIDLRTSRTTTNPYRTNSDRGHKTNPRSENNKRSVTSPKSHNKNYSSSRKRNSKLLCNRLIAAGMLSTALLLGGVTGYNINNARLESIEYSLDDYDKTELFNNTNDLIQYVAEDTYFEKNPDDKVFFEDYYLESYNEASVGGSDVTLKLNYTKISHEFEGGIDSKSIDVTLPKDFAKDVYLNYRDLRDSSRVSDEKKEKTAYWLKMNKCVTNLKDGLNNYMENTTNKDYYESAKDALKNSKIDHNLSKEDDERDF